jgi:hypothetical protein
VTECDQAWVVMRRDTGTLDGDKLDVVDALPVFWSKDAALREAERLRRDDPSEHRLYYCEATEVERQ